MPRLSAERAVTTTTEVTLKPSLVKKLKLKLDEYRQLCAQAKSLKKKIDTGKVDLETMFADSDEYEALQAGVKIDTPFGPVSVKIVTGKTAPKLDEKKLMTKFKLTPKDLDSCRAPGKDKKPYLGVYLPDDKDDDGDDE